MAVKKEATIQRWIGLSTDTKPTGVPIGATFYEYDTKLWYKTYDGTNWAILALDYGLAFGGTCNSGMTASQTVIDCADLAGYGIDYFNTQFYMQVVKNANSIGGAPDGEIRKITDYVTGGATPGRFTVDAFSANVEASDEIYILHKSIMLLLTELPEAGDWALADYDLFDVADADADNERWDVGYISGAAGGEADIDTTTSDKLYILADYNVGGALRYAVNRMLPLYADFYKIEEDVTSTFGATDGATAKAVGIGISAGTAYDANNYIFIERQKGTAIDRIQVRSNLNGAGEATTNVAITDDSVAFKIERLGETYALYYSTIQKEEGEEDWVKAAEVEDPSNYMTNQVTFYQECFNGSAGDATETAQGGFDNFYYWLGTGGGSQYIAGDYDSTWVSPDIDGSVFERIEAIQKAINITDAAVLTGFEEDGTGANVFNMQVAVQSVSTSAGDTNTLNDTGRTEANDYWIGSWLVCINGANAGLARPIVDSVASTSIDVRPAFPNTIATATSYAILTRGKVVVPGTDGTENFWPEDVIGSKADTADYTYNATASSAIRFLKGILGSRVIAEGTFTASSATVPADTGRTEGNDYFNGQILIPLTGSAAFQPRLIVDFTTTTDVFTIDADHPFTAATGTVAYIIVANEADLIPGTDSTNDQTTAQAVGAKADTADYTYDVTTSSLIRLVKGLLGSKVVGEGTLTADSATVPADTNRTEGNDYWNGCLLMTLTGNVAFQPRRIVDYTITTDVFTLDPNNPFTATPGLVAYVILSDQTEFVPAADATINRTPADVIGNKSDTIPAMNVAPGATDSLVRHTKAILERVGATPADPDDSLHTIAGQRDDAAPAMNAAPAATDTLVGHLKAIRETVGQEPADNDDSLHTIVGQRDDAIPAMNLSPSATDSLVEHIKAILERVGQTPADGDDSALTVLGQRDDSVDFTYDATAAIVPLIKGVLGSIVIEEGTLTTDSQTLPADTTIGGSYGNNYFNGCYLMTVAGAAAFQPRLIADFTITTGVFTLDAQHAFTALPALSAYVILAAQGDLVPAADQATNTTSAHVIGNKADAAATGAVTATDTLIAYIKQIINNLHGAAGIVTFPAGAAAANGVSIAEALRYASEEVDKVPKSDAAVTWNITALQSIQDEAEDALEGENLDHLAAVTDGAGNFPNTAVDGSIIAKILSKVAGGDTSSYNETTDSLEAISDLVVDVDAVVDEIPSLTNAKTWNATALASIEAEAQDAIQAEQLDHLTTVACGDITDPVDMTTEIIDDTIISNILTVEGDTSDYDRRTDSLEAISESVAEGFADQLVLHEVYLTGDMRNAAIATIYSLDAIAGTCKDIKCIVAFDGATAANITPILWMSDPDDTVTLDQVYPDLDAGHTHAGARTEIFTISDLGEGCQQELRFTSAGDDSGIDFDAVLTYLQ